MSLTQCCRDIIVGSILSIVTYLSELSIAVLYMDGDTSSFDPVTTDG